MGPVTLSPSALARRGAVLEVAGAPGSGTTSVVLSLLGPLSVEGPVAYVDTRGMVSPLAAADAGCDLTRLAFVRVPPGDGEAWAKAVAYLLDGIRAVAAETPRRVPTAALRALAARARTRSRLLALAPLGGRLPTGLATGRLTLGRPEGLGRFRVRLEGKLAQGAGGGPVEGVLAPPSLDLEPAAAARRLALVR